MARTLLPLGLLVFSLAAPHLSAAPAVGDPPAPDVSALPGAPKGFRMVMRGEELMALRPAVKRLHAPP